METKDWIKPHTIFEGIVGSTAYGLALEDSDVDTRGVCIPPRSFICGLDRFDQYEPSDTDTVIYNLCKFASLALNGNPNILELLWLPKEFKVVTTWYWDELLKYRDGFLSKRLIQAYHGYIKGQMTRMDNAKDKLPREGRNPKRADLEAKFGYDTKHASHVLRLCIQGTQLTLHQSMNVGLQHEDKLLCLDVKLGKYSYDQFKQLADEKIVKFREAEAVTKLLDTPDYNTINRCVTDLVFNHLCMVRSCNYDPK